MINGTPLITPSPSYQTGAQIPQPDGSFTLTADAGTGAVFSVDTAAKVLSTAPAGNAGPNQKMWLNPGGGSVNIYAEDGHTYCFQYDGRLQ